MNIEDFSTVENIVSKFRGISEIAELDNLLKIHQDVSEHPNFTGETQNKIEQLILTLQDEFRDRLQTEIELLEFQINDISIILPEVEP